MATSTVVLPWHALAVGSTAITRVLRSPTIAVAVSARDVVAIGIAAIATLLKPPIAAAVLTRHALTVATAALPRMALTGVCWPPAITTAIAVAP